MTIKEILEAHVVEVGRNVFTREEWLRCKCGWIGARVLSEGFDWEPVKRDHVAEVLEKHMQEREAQLRQLVRDMTDPGACWFDHHGGCQEHGYLDLKPGELCPHTEAKQLLGDEPNGR
ncbi:hypothetical protein ACFO7V_16695 [Glutamicibacter bergerei]|uniref:Uncharacterized protein n=1 Tax=Glutamicibacter bergerei TaxID=256702 RepID=A0ABV9MP71_9MICC|nr:hypothetical protein [Micrococcaceae bacterium]